MKPTNYSDQNIIYGDSKLLSLISHELRGSFNHILGISNLILMNEEVKTSDFKELVVSIQNTSKKSFVYLDNLIHLAKIEENEFPKGVERVNVEEVIRESIDLYKFQIDQKKIIIILSLTKDLEVKIEKSILQFILRNILSNAMKYSTLGGRIKIGSSLKNDLLEISIEDNGIGMSPSTINQIFNGEPLPSIRGTTDENGCGIGLKLSSHYLKKIDGDMVIASKLGEGTRIIVKIPIVKDNN